MKLLPFTLMFVLLLALSVYAADQSCSWDAECQSGGRFCDELNISNDQPQCSTPSTTGCNASMSISCTSNSDCNGLGPLPFCDTLRGICTMGRRQQLGGTCQLDGDCMTGYCSGDVCSNTPPTACSTPEDCDSQSFCQWPTYRCAAKQAIGGYCNGPLACQSNYCTSIITLVPGVCTECTGDVEYSDTHFCDIRHNATCSNAFFYPSFAYATGLPTGVITPKRETGSPCYDDACCLSNNCGASGRCLLAGQPSIYGNFTQGLCSGVNYSLATHYVDGVPYGSPGTPYFERYPINYTNLNFLFNRSDLRPIRGAFRTEWLYAARFDRGVLNESRGMFAYLYSNSTGDMCYVYQLNNLIYAECFESCLGSGLAHDIDTGAIHAYLEGAVLINSTPVDPVFSCTSTANDMVIQSRTGSSGYYGIWAINYFISSSVLVDTLLATDLAHGLQYYDGAWHNEEFSAVGGHHQYDTNAVLHGVEFFPFTTHRQVSFSSVTQVRGYLRDGAVYHTGTAITSYVDEADYTYVICCQSDNDCVAQFGNYFCCDTGTYTCYPCGEDLRITNLRFYALAADQSSGKMIDTADRVCHNETILLIAVLESIPIMGGTVDVVTDDVTITFQIDSGGGTLGTTTCNVKDMTGPYGEGCIVTYTAPPSGSSVDITAVSEHTSEYESATSVLTLSLSDLCHWLMIYVWDREGNEIPGAKICPSGLDCKWTSTMFNWARWDYLNSTPTSYITSFSKSGYNDGSTNIPLDTIVDITMYREDFTGLEYEPRTDYAIQIEPPTSTSELTGGVKNIFFGLAVWFFPWIFFVMILIFFLGLVYFLIAKVGMKPARGR